MRGGGGERGGGGQEQPRGGDEARGEALAGARQRDPRCGQAAGLGEHLDDDGQGEDGPPGPRDEGEDGQERGAVVGAHQPGADLLPGRQGGRQAQRGDHRQQQRDADHHGQDREARGEAAQDVAGAGAAPATAVVDLGAGPGGGGGHVPAPVMPWTRATDACPVTGRVWMPMRPRNTVGALSLVVTVTAVPPGAMLTEPVTPVAAR